MGLVLGLLGSVIAADPLPIGQPAPTTWKKMPGLPPVPVPPPKLPPTSNPPRPYQPLQPADAPSGTVPGRTVNFQKPPGSESTIPTVQPIPVPKLDPPTKKGDEPRPTNPMKTTPDLSTLDQLSLPEGLERSRVFRLDSDRTMRKRITMELIEESRRVKTKDPIDPKVMATNYANYPTVAPIAPEGAVYQPKMITQNYPPMQAFVEPSYVVYRRLYFEDKNSERYGWEVGLMQPALSALIFYKDLLLYPARFGSNLFERYDTSAGQCLPGSPVPYFLYPPEIDLFGGTLGAATIVGAAFSVFP